MTRASMVLALLLIVALSAVSARAASAAQPEPWHHPSSALPQLGPVSRPDAPVPAHYDEQIGITFSQNFTSIGYNVTAVAQSDSDGYGPAYLVNGLTNTGYWYQVGLSYDWPYLNGGYDSGFNLNYEAFDSSGNSIFPSSGGGGLTSLTGVVNNGDNVLLNLYFSGGDVTFLVKDWNTGASGSETYAAHGTEFIGLASADNPNGFFTGLMTEWYHASPYYGAEGQVTYTNPYFALTSAVLWADEYNANTSASIFVSAQSITFTNPTQLLSLSTNGATAYADAYTFITGSLGKQLITMSYSVLGGGAGYSAPVLSYVLDGTPKSVILTQVPTTYFADTGSNWQVAGGLPGSSSTERWQSNQTTRGNLTAAVTEDVVYFHQFLFTFGFSVKGGGTGFSPPEVQSAEFGTSVILKGGSTEWVDVSSLYTYGASLPGSSPTERWVALNTTGKITQPGIVEVSYFHQYSLTVSYALIGGGSPGVPTFAGTQFGKAFSVVVGNSSAYFLDPDSPWSLPALLPGSNSQVRWIANAGTNGTVTGAESIAATYRHEYAFAANVFPSVGGTTGLSSSWRDAGSSLQLSQSAVQGWTFVGWNGSGVGSYSGSSGSASILINSPIVENATFYPGLRISAGDNGEVSYSFGSQKGSVPAASSITVFAPQGTSIVLQATPSSFLYSFSGWSHAASGADSQTAVDLNAPTTVTASFSISLQVVEGIAAGVVVVIAAVAIALRSRGRSPG